MAAKTHGTAYVFGVDTTNPTSAQILRINVAAGAEIDATVKNSTGQTIHRRIDDIKERLSMTLRIESSFTRLVVGNVITLTTGAFAGDYLITETDEGKDVGDFVEYTVTAEAEEYLDLTP